MTAAPDPPPGTADADAGGGGFLRACAKAPPRPYGLVRCAARIDTAGTFAKEFRENAKAHPAVPRSGNTFLVRIRQETAELFLFDAY